MKKENAEKINRFFSRTLGCPEDFMENPESDIFLREETTEWNEGHGKNSVDIFVRNEDKIVSCRPDALAEVQKLERFLPDLEVSETSLEEKGLEVEEVHGPAFLGFIDEENFHPVRSDTRRISEEDAEQVSELKNQGDENEIEDSIGYFDLDDRGFGKFIDGDLAALASYREWSGDFAFISVYVSPKFRMKGFGKEVVSQVSEAALDENLIPCYRTLEKWKSSVSLAKSLGFEKYASTYLIKLG